MTPEELFKAGQLDDALRELQNQIRQDPSDEKLRIFLFQLLLINGEWARAHNQVKVIKELSAEAHLMAAVFQPLIEIEAFRKEVFSGLRSPLVFGEPEPFIGKLIQSLSLDPERSAQLRGEAFEEAPARSGQINGKAFEWIMDADCRLGPVLEIVVERKYYWMGFHHVKSISAEEPADLRDLVWIPVAIRLVNGGQLSGYLFVRYPGSESSSDPAIRLSRVTEWEALPGGMNIGLGQRLLATDQDDIPLLDLRLLEFETEYGISGE